MNRSLKRKIARIARDGIPNRAAIHSFKNGKPVLVGTTTYRGAVPVYQGRTAALGQPVQYYKVAKGIPFVRLEHKSHIARAI